MKKQFAVLGLGGFGASVAVTLQKLGCEVVAVDQDMERIEDIAERVTYAMQADIGNPEFLESLGSRNFDGIVVAESGDIEASIMATLVAKEIGVPYVLCKANSKRHAEMLKKIGADAVVFPEKEIGKRIAKNLLFTDLADWIALSPDYSVMEIETPKKWVGKTLKELNLRKVHEMNVIGIRDGEEMDVTPDADKPLKAGTILIIMGSNQALEKL